MCNITNSGRYWLGYDTTNYKRFCIDDSEYTSVWIPDCRIEKVIFFLVNR